VEAAILDHENERIQLAHLLAAAYELPLSDSDTEVFGEHWRERADALVTLGELRRGQDGRYLPRGPRFPAGDISLRSASPDSVVIVDRGSGEVLGSVEAERAFTTVHPGAVYLHLGRSYEVRELDIEARRAVVDRFDGDWYTQPRKETEVYIERTLATSDEPIAAGTGLELCFGELSVTEQVMAFQRKRLSDHEVVDMVALDLPETNFPTQGLWYVLGDELAGPAALPVEVLLGALHATEHGQIAVLPLLAMCDRWDIGGLSTNVHFQTGRPSIFIYDGHPGGVGIARRGFDLFSRLVFDAAKLIGECPCADGCPSCVQSPKCGNLNEPLHKQGAVELMTAMLARAGARPADTRPRTLQ
jgi:DEAD/DEAH box helicase domain-containing protein